jgi:F-type H+-transporting ATPase subunit epsilon
MFARAAVIATRVAGRSMASTAAAPTELVLNFAVPSAGLVSKKEVKRVTLPGRDGSFGIEKNSPAMLSELRPGVVRVDYADNSTEDFFIPGGFSFKHAHNVMDVSAPEGVKLDQVDVEALRAANSEATKRRDAATAGSKEHAEAKLSLEVYRALAQALKVTV